MAVDMNRGEAVRAVAEAYARDLWNYPPDVAEALIAKGFGGRIAEIAVDALVAAGWGDLTAERERLAADLRTKRDTDYPLPSETFSHSAHLVIGIRDGLTLAAARLIREDTP